VCDVAILDQGSLIGFLPKTKAAADWFQEHVESEGWQWFGPVLWVDHRNANDLIIGISNADLVVEAQR